MAGVCGEEVLPSAPRFRCAECSGFYLHKVCAEAPLEISHPYHHNHPLVLLQNSPYPSGGWGCDFCDKSGDSNLKELEHVASEDPTTKTDKQLENLDCKITVHVNCAAKNKVLYYVVDENEDEDERSSDSLELCPITVIEINDTGEAIEIKHFKHVHNLMLGHPHPLLFYYDYEGKYHGCGVVISAAYYCKVFNFALDLVCMTLPTRVQHKCDEKHLLALTYGDNNDYSATHYCDICEETKDPSHSFYHCATCDTSAHVNCVLGEEPFIKLGSIYKQEDGDYPHPPTFVKKMYYYPECSKCYIPCEDLALECSEPGCNFITDWFCCHEWKRHVHS
ncbi:DC1 domain-containing protein [Corchorus olitorius]|uniref:DC1 domain-containing protein n=1 Tax=Corchorus olitorius TaxID=93759 RepID=A0A1R3KEX6_9ROSI|nr:DC1 domain-containing protein [Corchorus olitorius]